MNYLIKFESFKHDYLDNKKFYNRIIYRGVSLDEKIKFENDGSLGNFFTENKDFASDYGYVLKFKLKTDNVFGSLDPRNIRKLYDMGYILFDKYEDTEYLTYEDYMKFGSTSDTWDVIENSSVINWILTNYDVINITEGGVSNYYIEDHTKIEFIES